MKGLIRRIGDGTLTYIWQDRWLPDHFEGRPLTPEEGQHVSMVSDLLSDNDQWDAALIKEIFFPVDVAAILHTPTWPCQSDIWAWEPERHGFYLVKFAYRLLDEA